MLSANAVRCWPAIPSDASIKRLEDIAPTAGAAGAPTSRLRDRGNKNGLRTGGEGGSWKSAWRKGPAKAVQRAAPPSPEATRKTLQQANTETTTTTEEKEEEKADGKGPTGDLTDYVPTGEDWRIREVYGDWVHSNNV